MGILSNACVNKNNILTDHGFSREYRNVTGEMKQCYEKCIDLGPYYAWIGVDPDTRRVIVYIEFECGGEIATHKTNLTHSWSDQGSFFEELDEFVTDLLKHYQG